MGNFNRGRSSGGGNFRNRPVTMHQAVCDSCGKDCQVPFRPTSGKPIYCSNCFGEKKGAGSKENGQSQSQFEALNNKLDRILQLLDSKTILEVQRELDPQPQEQVVAAEETKVVKKRSSKKS